MVFYEKYIVKYKDINENYNCCCNSSWYDNCSTKNFRSENECNVSIGGILLVDFAVREIEKSRLSYSFSYLLYYEVFQFHL